MSLYKDEPVFWDLRGEKGFQGKNSCLSKCQSLPRITNNRWACNMNFHLKLLTYRLHRHHAETTQSYVRTVTNYRVNKIIKDQFQHHWQKVYIGLPQSKKACNLLAISNLRKPEDRGSRRVGGGGGGRGEMFIKIDEARDQWPLYQIKLWLRFTILFIKQNGNFCHILMTYLWLKLA